MANVFTDYDILEKSENQFTVVFGGKHYGYFTSKAGAEAYLTCLLQGRPEDCKEKANGKVGV